MTRKKKRKRKRSRVLGFPHSCRSELPAKRYCSQMLAWGPRGLSRQPDIWICYSGGSGATNREKTQNSCRGEGWRHNPGSQAHRKGSRRRETERAACETQAEEEAPALGTELCRCKVRKERHLRGQGGKCIEKGVASRTQTGEIKGDRWWLEGWLIPFEGLVREKTGFLKSNSPNLRCDKMPQTKNR